MQDSVPHCYIAGLGTAPLLQDSAPSLPKETHNYLQFSALASTAASTEVGISVSQEDQGQAQAVLLLLGYVGAALGCLLGPRLYAPEASVLRASLPFLVGAGVAVATALGLVATAPRRVAGLEEALLEDGDDEDESEV